MMLSILGSCQKATNTAPSTARTFIKTYATDSTTQAVSVEQFPNGDFLLGADEGAGRPVLIQTDQYGNMLWQKTINNYLCFYYAGAWDIYNDPDPYHLIMQGGAVFTQTDNLGNILNQTNLLSTYPGLANYNISPLLANTTNYFVGTCNGLSTSSPSDNTVFAYDKNLQNLHNFTFTDADIKGKNIGFFVYDYKSGGSIKISGEIFPRKNWTFRDNHKVYAAIITPGKPTIETMVDTGDQRHSDYTQWPFQTVDSGFLIPVMRQDNLTNTSYPVAMKFDKNAKLNWEKEYHANNNALVIGDASQCSDGGYLLCGYVGTPAAVNSQPYVMKTDANGNKEWDRTIPTAGQFFTGIKTTDGGYAIIGYANAFGKGKNGSTVLFVKLDAKGNL